MTACGDPQKAIPAHREDVQRGHVLLITVDTLRSDYLSGNGYDQPTTPYLDSLLAGGVQFPRTYTTVPRTTPALASLMTGAYPHTTGVRTLVDAFEGGTCLAELLLQRGYRTAAVVSNHILIPKRKLRRGFEHYDHADDIRDARATTQAALDYALRFDRDESIFLWVHYIDPHVPYLPPKEFVELFDAEYQGRYAGGFGTSKGGVGDKAYPSDLPKEKAVFQNDLPPEVNAHIRRLYAADIRSVDEQIARLVEGLRNGLRNDWLIVFTSDHGEALGEHDFFYDHGDYVYNPSLEVPLAFVLPPGDPLARSRVVQQRVSLVDVFPTLLDLLAVELPAGARSRVEGRSLLPALEGKLLPSKPVFAESGRSFYPGLVKRRKTFDIAGRFRAVIVEDWKLIWTPGQDQEQSFELYHLATDPGELRNVYAPDHPQAGKLRGYLKNWYKTSTTEEKEMSAENRQRLQSLGYL